MLHHLTLAVGLACTACSPSPHAVPLPPGTYHPIAPGGGVASLRHLERLAPAANCGEPLRLLALLPDPVDLPDRQGEWLELGNEGPEAVALDDWHLSDGRRRRALDDLIIEAHATLRVGGPTGALPLWPVRLTNGGGRVTLLDPCGLEVSSIAWGRPACPKPPPGWRVEAIGAPAGAEPGRSIRCGGCGQT